MSRIIRIGTRESELALWQAKHIQNQLATLGFQSELTLIKSDGELNLTSPLYEMGVQGIFTKTLDIALLQGKIDVAVHSLKDVPTQIPQGITLIAVPERGNTKDVLVYKDTLPANEVPFTVATSSLRRSAQWMHRYKNHSTEVLRGNINTRLQKLHDNQHWNGALFAAAGIERIKLDVPNVQELDWMIPAPAQGALGVVCRTDDEETKEICRQLNHENTFTETLIERSFLRLLMGGCSMPIGGNAVIQDHTITFKGCVLSIDGQQKAEVLLEMPITEKDQVSQKAVEIILTNGGKEILASFQK